MELRFFMMAAVMAGLIGLSGCRSAETHENGKVLTAAVAASASEALRDVAAAFEDKSGVRLEISVGATGVLQRQAEQGAPYDLFIAADMETPILLAERGVLVDDSLICYARGRLVLWQSSGAQPAMESLEGLKSADWANARLSLANPDTAPYGKAAVEALRDAGLLERFEDRLVYASNVRHALELAESGNVDAALTAASLVTAGEGRTLEVPLPRGIMLRQGAGVMAESEQKELAEDFLRFLLSVEGQRLLRARGFRSPSAVGDSGRE